MKNEKVIHGETVPQRTVKRYHLWPFRYGETVPLLIDKTLIGFLVVGGPEAVEKWEAL